MIALSADDLFYFNEGRHFRLYSRLGAHITSGGGVDFAVWAPNAKSVSVIGDFNGWTPDRDMLSPHDSSGIWAGHIAEAKKGDVYKYFIRSHHNDLVTEKADPFAFCTETPPKTGSVIWALDYQWQDADWLAQRGQQQKYDKPMSVYEVHLGSWRRKVEEGNRWLSYTELADQLVSYVRDMGFTHVEFMPIMEYPFGGSWGYQITSYYAPTRRYGDPQELMHLIDKCHQAGIGVILDWVPSHFTTDAHGLGQFDGTALYEHADPRQGYHPDWGSYIFNYNRNEVRSFLISNAMFWFDKYHVDALRVDAVASMLYLDYSRKAGEWLPNDEGGRENKAAVQFLRELNTAVYQTFPDVQMIAEESTSWPGVSHPVNYSGLGFGFKWDMGWMHDTLHYFQRDPLHRKFHQDELTFHSLYAFHENFVLALSHDEVVHGKGSLLNKMAGYDEEKFAQLRCLYTYMYATPGKKLLFMGGDLAQWAEWNHDLSLDWHLLGFEKHAGIQRLLRNLNQLYARETALHIDGNENGFQWIDASDWQKSILCFLRLNPQTGEKILCVFNLTPMTHRDYRIGVSANGQWREIFNSDASLYGGYGQGNPPLQAEKIAHHGQAFSLNIILPGLSGILLKQGESVTSFDK